MKLITTSDGSHSLFVPELNETYHSRHGAIQESKHVFIEAGLKSEEVKTLPKSKPTHILEIGFGTGLNAFLTYLEANTNTIKSPIHYTSLEAYPIDFELATQLNYPKLLNTNEYDTQSFKIMHDCPWEKVVAITSNFHLTKLQQKLEEANLPDNHFHLVYYDAFAPEKQAELWTEDIFTKIYACMQPKGVLTTYCAKGVVKRTLKKVGFEVVALPGPSGKREMTKVIK